MPRRNEQLSKKNKLLIGVFAGVTVGVISYFVWNKLKVDEKPDPKEMTWSALSMNDIDDRQNVEEKTQSLPEECEYITHSDLKNLITTTPSDMLIIDVRDNAKNNAESDYIGGHINGSINISDRKFYESIPDLIKKYHEIKSIIIVDMYGVHRSIRCIQCYAKSISELITNYSAEKQSSFYNVYLIKKERKFDNDAVNVDVDVNSSNMSMLYGAEEYEYMDNVITNKVDIDFVNDEIIQNLKQQKLFLLKGGYFEFINSSIMNIENSQIIKDFDKSQYEQLELTGIYDKKMWYHKNEYFAKAKFLDLKKHLKSKNFKLNSSFKQ